MLFKMPQKHLFYLGLDRILNDLIFHCQTRVDYVEHAPASKWATYLKKVPNSTTAPTLLIAFEVTS